MRDLLTALKSLMIASFRLYAGLAILGAVLTFVALAAWASPLVFGLAALAFAAGLWSGKMLKNSQINKWKNDIRRSFRAALPRMQPRA
jgi:pilus assembly protein TadC